MEFTPNECSWDKFKKGGEITVCSSPEVIKKMAEFLKSLGENIKDDDINNVKNRMKIVEKLKEKSGCDSESCAVQDKDFTEFAGPSVVKKNIAENFKSRGPANSTTWLSNFDIDETLEEIKKTYNDEKFWNIPFQMRDFKDNRPSPGASTFQKNSNLETFDFRQKYSEGYKCFGVVLNTDRSSGSGQHWFCLFIDARDSDKITIEYFNSTGEEPLTEIQAWLSKTRLLLEKHFPNREINVIKASQTEHQTDDHSCGVYALYYIISRVAKIPYKYFQDNIVQSTRMHKFRQFLFRAA